MGENIRSMIIYFSFMLFMLSGCGSSSTSPGLTADKSVGVFAKGATGVFSGQIEHNHAELEGLIADYDEAAASLTLNGVQVLLTPTTVYSHGAKSELANEVKVAIKGDISNGILTARTVDVDGDHGLLVQRPLPPVLPFLSVPATDKKLYDTLCSNCHVLGSAGSAPNLIGSSAAIAKTLAGGHKNITVSAQQSADLTNFVNSTFEVTAF